MIFGAPVVAKTSETGGARRKERYQYMLCLRQVGEYR